MILLSTQHGSHLYNLANEDSDHDTFTVIADNPTVKGRYAKQKIHDVDGITMDETVTDLSTFVLYASKGVPQYLEAMWAPVEAVDVDVIHDMRFAFRPDYYKTQDTYQRTIRNFYEDGSFKKRRHAYRLVVNMLEFRRKGIFNPRLDDQDLESINEALKIDIDPLELLE